jgi:hypothetical protein
MLHFRSGRQTSSLAAPPTASRRMAVRIRSGQSIHSRRRGQAFQMSGISSSASTRSRMFSSAFQLAPTTRLTSTIPSPIAHEKIYRESPELRRARYVRLCLRLVRPIPALPTISSGGRAMAHRDHTKRRTQPLARTPDSWGRGRWLQLSRGAAVRGMRAWPRRRALHILHGEAATR